MKHNTNYDKVREFHTAFGAALDEDPEVNPELVELRSDLIAEEYEEVLEELDLFLDPDVKTGKKGLAKELADLLYVVYGTAATFGIDIDTVFNLVHESNMSKLGPDGKPFYRADGKVLKPDTYKPVNLDGVV